MSEFFVGCDVSKGYADFVVLNQQQEVVEKDFQLDDTAEGHSALCEFLERLHAAHEGATIYIAVESTGGYERNWYALLLRQRQALDLRVALVNPSAVLHHYKSLMKRNKTDGVSAFAIASYLAAHGKRIRYNEHDEEFAGLRRAWTALQLQIKQKAQLLNQLEKLLYQCHPGLLRYCKNRVPRWLLFLVAKYPTAHKLGRARVSSVARLPYVSHDKAQALVEEAKQTVAGCGTQMDAFTVQQLAERVCSLTEGIEQFKTQMEADCSLPEVKLLCSIKGIGTYSAIGLMINIVDINRFSCAKKLASYFGLHPVSRQSGDGEWGVQMSKQGRVEPRAILYMAAMSALGCNPLIEALYKRCLERGMNRMAAIGVCMHKMLRIVYGVLSTNTPFDVQVDERNRKRAHRARNEDHVRGKRRLQAFDEKAPVSGRQSRTRAGIKKGPWEPQRSNAPQCGVIPDPSDKDRFRQPTAQPSTTRQPVAIAAVLGSVMAEATGSQSTSPRNCVRANQPTRCIAGTTKTKPRMPGPKSCVGAAC